MTLIWIVEGIMVGGGARRPPSAARAPSMPKRPIYPCAYLNQIISLIVSIVSQGLIELFTQENTGNVDALTIVVKMADFFKKRIDAVIASKGWG